MVGLKCALENVFGVFCGSRSGGLSVVGFW